MLEENIGKRLLDTGFGNDFFGYDTKNTGNKKQKQTVGIASD